MIKILNTDTGQYEIKEQIEPLIWDRIDLDIIARNKKSYYNYNDFNRIETWCEYLEKWINQHSYYVEIKTKTTWNMHDFPTASEIERIRRNIVSLKDAYFAFTQIPENLNLMTIQKANTVEKILYEIDKILGDMSNNFIYCGISALGQERTWQKRFRKAKTWIAQPYKLSQFASTDTLSMIATDSNQAIASVTVNLDLAQMDKRDDVFASLKAFNESIMALDRLVGSSCYYYSLRNILPEIGTETFDNGTKSTEHTKYSNNTLMITGISNDNEEYAISNGTYDLNQSHIYYVCVEAYSETGVGSIDFFFPPASPSFFGGKALTAGAWAKHSIVSNRSSFSTGKYSYRLDYNNGGVVDRAWFDGVMIIDLTKTFGAGNEPTLTWCNQNIPYFTGTKEIKIEKEN